MILVRRKSQVETSKVMKGGINFELKADNIIHAAVAAPKHFINIFEILPDGKKKAYIRKKEKARLLRETQHQPFAAILCNLCNLTWRTGMAGVFARLFV